MTGEVSGTDRAQIHPYKPTKARLTRCLFYGKQEQFNSLNVNMAYTGWLILLANAAMSWTSICQHLHVLFTFFCSSGSLALPLIFLEENCQYSCILVCNFFSAICNWSRCRSRWENLNRFQPIKFVNSVGYSTCDETQLVWSYEEMTKEYHCTLNTLYLFSDWPKAYSEFSKSVPLTSSSCRLYNNHVKDTQG